MEHLIKAEKLIKFNVIGIRLIRALKLKPRTLKTKKNPQIKILKAMLPQKIYFTCIFHSVHGNLTAKVIFICTVDFIDGF